MEPPQHNHIPGWRLRRDARASDRCVASYTEGRMTTHSGYIPALGLSALTPLYDPVLRYMTRE